MKTTQETNRNKKKHSPKRQPGADKDHSENQTSKKGNSNANSSNANLATGQFPLGRIRTIMKSSLDTGQITNEVLFLMAKSTEMFIQQLTKDTFANIQDGSNNIKYEHLSQLVQQNENLEFLLQIIPQKIKVRDFKKIIQEASSESSSSDSES